MGRTLGVRRENFPLHEIKEPHLILPNLADVHVNDTPGELAPYCDMPWRLSLADLAKSSYPYLLMPGFAPNFKPDPPIPGGQPTHSVDTAALMRNELTELGIEFDITTGVALVTEKYRVRQYPIRVLGNDVLISFG